jgi:hypothetical protein
MKISKKPKTKVMWFRVDEVLYKKILDLSKKNKITRSEVSTFLIKKALKK